MHTQYVYDDNDRLETAGGQTFTYDLNGNTKTVTEDANVTTSMYDQDNRLIAMQIVESGSLVEDITYEYDAGGIRTKKVVNGVETNFLVDQNRDYSQVLLEYTDLNQELAFYVFGDDLLSVTKYDAVGGSDKRWYQHDGMTSVRHLSDDTGAITDSYAYAAYGTILSESGDFDNVYLMHGEARDPETGNIYLRARYYSPGIKRFTQQDSFQGFEKTPLSLNKYGFVHGDGGINNIDPSGNFTLTQMSIGTAILATALTFQQVGSSAIDGFFNPALPTDPDDIDDFEIGLLIIYAMGTVKPWTLLETRVSDKTEEDNDPVDYYRAVDTGEAVDIMDCDCFRFPDAGYGIEPTAVKRFWLDESSAKQFGQYLKSPVPGAQQNTFFVVSATVSAKTDKVISAAEGGTNPGDAFIGNGRAVGLKLLPLLNFDIRQHGGVKFLGEY